MKTFSVQTFNAVEGFHKWPEAPESAKFLASEHRHVFEIRCNFPVTDPDREIELILKQRDIDEFLESSFGRPCLFGDLSCERIAERLLEAFPEMNACRVLEDGFGGAEAFR